MPEKAENGTPPHTTETISPRQLLLENKVLWRLFRRHCMGGKHMNSESLCGGIPRSDYGIVREAIEIF
jgi:hypothetical protein